MSEFRVDKKPDYTTRAGAQALVDELRRFWLGQPNGENARFWTELAIGAEQGNTAVYSVQSNFVNGVPPRVLREREEVERVRLKPKKQRRRARTALEAGEGAESFPGIGIAARPEEPPQSASERLSDDSVDRA